MNLLALAIAGHLIGDWIIQTDQQAANKMTSWAANQRHMAGYHATLYALCAWAGPLEAAIIVAVSWPTHSIIDRRWPVTWLMEHTGSAPFAKTPWGPLAVDQALHLAILCLTVAALTP